MVISARRLRWFAAASLDFALKYCMSDLQSASLHLDGYPIFLLEPSPIAPNCPMFQLYILQSAFYKAGLPHRRALLRLVDWVCSGGEYFFSLLLLSLFMVSFHHFVRASSACATCIYVLNCWDLGLLFNCRYDHASSRKNVVCCVLYLGLLGQTSLTCSSCLTQSFGLVNPICH